MASRSRKDTSSKKSSSRESGAAAPEGATALEMVLPDLDQPSLRDLALDDERESRSFYQWLDAHWGSDQKLEEHPPTRFLLDELDERGSRIQKLALDLEQARERLLEREVQIVRLEAEALDRQRALDEMARDLEGLGERYRKALQAASESRRMSRELEQDAERLRAQDSEHAAAVALLHQQMEELMAQMAELELNVPPPPPFDEALEQRLREADERNAELDRMRRAEGDRYREIFGEKDNAIHGLQRTLSEREAELASLRSDLAAWPVPQAIRIARFLAKKR
jgi:DNA repair exonuclease SbcCD ATPase subunit